MPDESVLSYNNDHNTTKHSYGDYYLPSTVLTAVRAFAHLYPQQLYHHPRVTGGLPKSAGWLRSLPAAFVAHTIGIALQTLSSRAVFMSPHPTVPLSVIYLKPGRCFHDNSRRRGVTVPKSEAMAGRELDKSPLHPSPFSGDPAPWALDACFLLPYEEAKGFPSFCPVSFFCPTWLPAPPCSA